MIEFILVPVDIVGHFIKECIKITIDFSECFTEIISDKIFGEVQTASNANKLTRLVFMWLMGPIIIVLTFIFFVLYCFGGILLELGYRMTKSKNT